MVFIKIYMDYCFSSYPSEMSNAPCRVPLGLTVLVLCVANTIYRDCVVWLPAPVVHSHLSLLLSFLSTPLPLLAWNTYKNNKESRIVSNWIPVQTLHVSRKVRSQVDSFWYRCERTQDALRSQWDLIAQTTFWPHSFSSVDENVSWAKVKECLLKWWSNTFS